MPYIDQERRIEIDSGEPPETPGELDYLLTSLCLDYISQAPAVSYGLLNEVLGVLEAVKQEYYRKFVVPYEDRKIEENGDVF